MTPFSHGEKTGRFGARAGGALAWASLQDGMGTVPCHSVDDGVVLAGAAIAVVDCLASLSALAQHAVRPIKKI
jgi:hypothetical protein